MAGTCEASVAPYCSTTASGSLSTSRDFCYQKRLAAAETITEKCDGVATTESPSSGAPVFRRQSAHLPAFPLARMQPHRLPLPPALARTQPALGRGEQSGFLPRTCLSGCAGPVHSLVRRALIPMSGRDIVPRRGALLSIKRPGGFAINAAQIELGIRIPLAGQLQKPVER